MKYYFYIKTLGFVLLAVIIGACNKDEVAEKWAKEEAELKAWINENAPNAIFENGIYFEIIRSKSENNIKPESDDHVLVNFVCSFIDGVVEQVSFKSGQTNHKPLYLSDYKEGGPELWPSDYWSKMGIEHMRENDIANIYIPSRVLGLQDFKSRKYEMELVRVIENLKNYQEDLMSRYMEKNFRKNFNTDTILINGREHVIFFHINNKNAGDEEIDIASVRTRYDEYYFLEDNDRKLCVQNQLKIGWDKKFSEMFKSVKKGAEITAMMPYRVMHGEEPYMNANKQFIAPLGSVLKYEIKIDP